MSEFRFKFGKRLQELRKNRGFSQEFFAELIGISPRNLSKIETGKTFPSVEKIERILVHLECDSSQLFNFEHLANSEILHNLILEKIKKLNAEKLVMLFKFLNSIE